MADALSLPRLRREDDADSYLARKRVRFSSPPISSDPALFSSDDDPSADNYTQERRKKKLRGPWYRLRPASDAGSDAESQNKSKRTFERQFDSGVFMGSDGTDMMSDGPEELISGGESKLPLRQWLREKETQPPSAEELAAGQIQLCLEDNNETIDLSSRGLTTISNETIRPLALLTRLPPVAEGVFHQLEPHLQIFLASNQLTTLPGELFNLHRTSVLILRNNQIRELPSGIGKLSSLRELNLSQNGLRYLPFEILELFSGNSRMNHMILHPNLFHEPQFPPEENEKEEPIQYKIGLGSRTTTPRRRRGAICRIFPDQTRILLHPKWRCTYQARTEVRYLDINGSLVQGPSLTSNVPPSSQATPYSIPVADEDYVPAPPNSRGNQISRAPSLLEIALNAIPAKAELPYLQASLPEEMSHLHELLESAVLKRDSGGSCCTTCKRSFIIPRTEWIEWWEIAKVVDHRAQNLSAASPLRQMENERDVLESMVPLMRRGCSWLCVPERLRGMEDEAMADD